MSGFTGLFKGLSKKLSSKGGQTGNQQVVKPTDDEKKAISELNNLTEEVKQKSNKLPQKDYTDLLKEIDKLKKSAGNSSEALAAKEAIDKEMLVLEDKRKKYGAKQMNYAEIIDGERKTPLETLIKKQHKLKKDEDTKAGGSSSITPEGMTVAEEASQQQQQQPTETTSEKLKRRAKKYIGNPIVERIKEAFADWKSSIDTVTGLLAGVFDMTGGGAGFADDIEDKIDVVKKLKDAKKGIKAEKSETGEFDKSAGGIISSVTSGLSAFVKSIKFVTDMVKEGQTDANAGGEVIRDHQERWKLARGYIRDLKDIFFAVHDIFAPLTAAIPFYGSISSIVKSGADMLLDVVEMADTSYRIDQMRKERNRIYKRMMMKKAKYAAKGLAKEAEAYDVTHQTLRKQNRDVDAKRKALMKTVFEEQIGTGDDKITAKSSLRSRNDSQYRDIQYGIGARINTATDKNQKRHLEALEMMQDYRNVDKAHKKMGKKLGHILESIIKGGVSITADGLKLAGEVAASTGVGAAPGAGLIAGGVGTKLALTSYEQIREGASKVYSLGKKISGTQKNKDTTREDMAITLIDKMEEIATNTTVWDETQGFKEKTVLVDSKNRKDVIREGRNVDHLHKVLRSGLDVTMSDLIQSKSRAELKEKIAGSFGQD